MKNSLLSDQMIWSDISGEWSLITDKMSKVMDACRETTTINTILANAPADVGGTIEFLHSIADAENLYYQFQVFFRFTDGIHYEADEFIDIPFTQKLRSVLEKVYEVNPKDFRTKNNFLFIPCGNSMEELLIGMVSVESLKESYKTMIDSIDDDVIENDLVEVFETADYWARQYELAAEIREIHNEYIEAYANEWVTLPADKRLSILNEYAVKVGKVIDERNWFTRLFSHELISKVEWSINDPNYNSESTAYAYTRSLSRDGKIYINSDAITNTTKYDLEFLLNTVTHETRHQYQGQAKYRPKTFEIPTTITDNWLHDYSIEYYIRPWEIDARAFAALSLSYKKGTSHE